ncbi:hypothetical protein pEaSNUABM28_00129 [Erwinia phage pEa_SNUABM_28]|uniref:Uncharacterized protein n=2 Tax=Alexandravirus TaxID=2733088 RepID=A0AAE8XRD8_9CAUD|nr:hypothetical protein MPK63_gp126 [Erwinia phage pEa_SNUABM_22]YP_010299888.1 hypothetical protein MPK64_gp127 [Erwinia phage pEa_SNUABM_16]QZE58686.1 hypothetical protein pEaSNUABM28_00129 [Erwinia phage pEa_SNUABM_28]QZE59030.1 hypothetical protein pEaSNUABM18_00127 [Erwinia phage pEa_SNUABM_18]UAW96271.1 hypothetical protein pEaSNUABM16_00127 [Erwinia phage pEa_SNUABM_16]UAW96614.1 hypothetical protein pEaSNUABM22_00127 [Erwinia phage pEa_SNUABM_22]
MLSVAHRTMNFAYLENGVPRVVTARVLLQYPLGLQNSAAHVLSNIVMQRKNIFVINDEEFEFQSGNLVTDHVTWKFSDRNVTAIPRAEKDPTNRSCICCAMADYFTRCMQSWLRNRRNEAELITVDVIVADHEDYHYVQDTAPDLGAKFYQASVFVLESSSNTWSNMGVLFTDKPRYDGHTIFIKETGFNPISASHLQIDLADFNPYGGHGDVHSLGNVVGHFSDKFTVFNGILNIKGAGK